MFKKIFLIFLLLASLTYGCNKKVSEEDYLGSYVAVITKTVFPSANTDSQAGMTVSLTTSFNGHEQYIYVRQYDILDQLIEYINKIDWKTHLATSVYDEMIAEGALPNIVLGNVVNAIKADDIDYINNGESFYRLKNPGLGSNNVFFMPYYIFRFVDSDSKTEPLYLSPFNGLVGYQQNIYVFDCNDEVFDLARNVYRDSSELINSRLFYNSQEEFINPEKYGKPEWKNWYLNYFFNTCSSSSCFRQYMLPEYISMKDFAESLGMNGLLYADETLQDFIEANFGDIGLNQLEETEDFIIKCIYDGGLNISDCKEYIVTIKN